MPDPQSYSVQLYTVRGDLEADMSGTIKKIAEIGFSQVEPYRFTEKTDELAGALRANGLSAPSGHAPLLRASQDEIFTAANKLGITTVIDPHVGAERWTTPEDIAGIAQEINAAARKGASYGVRVGYHNHWFEVETDFEGRTGLEVLAENLDPDVVLEVDTYWVAVAGKDPVDIITRLGERVRFVHIKDGAIDRNNKSQVALGNGRMPVWDILNAAKHLEAAVVELDDSEGDLLGAVRDSFNYLAAGKVSA